MMRSIMQGKIIKRFGIGLAVAAFWVGVWWIAALAVDQTILIPTPWHVLQTLAALVKTATFWKAVLLSLVRICLGFLAALMAGTVLATITVRYAWLRTLVSPLLQIVRAAPVASFIILTLVWIATDSVPIFISFLMVLPIVWVNVEEGLRRVDLRLKEVATVYRFGHWKTLTKVTVPSVMPFFLTACVNGLGFAWKSGIAAEVICLPALSIGRQLHSAKLTLETPEVFAWTVVVVLLSMVLERLLLQLTTKFTSFQRKEEHDDNR